MYQSVNVSTEVSQKLLTQGVITVFQSKYKMNSNFWINNKKRLFYSPANVVNGKSFDKTG
jgi:hypothetical protein